MELPRGTKALVSVPKLYMENQRNITSLPPTRGPSFCGFSWLSASCLDAFSERDPQGRIQEQGLAHITPRNKTLPQTDSHFSLLLGIASSGL